MRLRLFDQEQWQAIGLLAEQQQLTSHEQQVVRAKSVVAAGFAIGALQQLEFQALQNLAHA